MTEPITNNEDELRPIPMINGLDCPACNHPCLMLGDGGYVTCAYIECPNPDYAEAIQELINKRILEANTELLDALYWMYIQYCGKGHYFMGAGETASELLENAGYIEVDGAGIITKDNCDSQEQKLRQLTKENKRMNKDEELRKEYENAMSVLLEKWRELDPGFVAYVEKYGGYESSQTKEDK